MERATMAREDLRSMASTMEKIPGAAYEDHRRQTQKRTTVVVVMWGRIQAREVDEEFETRSTRTESASEWEGVTATPSECTRTTGKTSCFEEGVEEGARTSLRENVSSAFWRRWEMGDDPLPSLPSIEPQTGSAGSYSSV